jgi:signal peptide peptidase SppA
MDTASLIRLVNDRIKPVVAFTEGSMMSAAYWLGMSAGRTLASPTAAVGSIGVLSTHREVSEALKKEGINVTVLRAGKYKALANSFEPLSQDGREQIQKSLDALYDVFVGQVAAMRGKPEAWVDEHMAQGREFLGEEAVSAGLVDGITTYDALFAELTSQTLDTQEKKKQTPFQSKNPIFKGSDMKKAFSQIELAAISTLSSTDAQKLFAGEAELAPAPEAAAAAVPSADAPQAAEAPAPVPEAAAAGTETAAAPQPAAPPDAVVSLLREQLAEAQAALLSARVEAESMKKELAQSADSMQAFVRIAATSASNMSIALGGAALSESLPHSTLLAEHQRLETAFKEKFKVGGVAATDSGGAPNNVVSIDPLYRARMAAVRFGVKRET